MIERKPLFPDLENVKVKSEGEPVADQADAHLRFLHATVGVFLLSPGWDTSLSQGYPPALISPVLIYTPSYRKAQHNVPDQGSNPDRSIWRRAHYRI